ncbi:hypothetical protein BDK51DRAFT_27529 [Blyttiomyces helicus]|uniref:Uncharacterized protein n=1 Tax=Blyttiomyces helicus TaxID=388810 RepID=A0A4P9W9C4_9FUNG|nr:hypothetical protein BDK51DRAFT_27529 [Blyttiomyces helicus]|eukprot:RKO88762.1 hypothetical protein BDK51DRAFT_27529 [Blyttiomyces helicus]
MAGFPGSNTEACWVAVFTFFIIWLLGLFFVPFAGNLFKGSEGGIRQGANNFARASRDAFLILLAVVVANQAGDGLDTTCWRIWWMDMLMLLPIVGLAIADFALAFP